MPKFGHLSRVELRQIWANEAADFTPWLADHLAALGDALGMDLEVRERESAVGGFSLDILAYDVARGRKVVIENQLTVTDHDHLGKLLTYAAGHDAGVIVWIAREFREEHRQTLDWLNQHTDEHTEFFAVVIEVLKIDESQPAFNFRLVAFPNEWRKRRVGGGGELSTHAEAYRVFFQGLIDELRERHRFTGARVGQPQNWYAFASGISGISYSTSFAWGNRVRTELYLDRGDAAFNKELFDRLIASESELEAEFGEPLTWERLDDKRACRIAVYRPGSIDDDGQALEDIRQWAVERLLKFKQVLFPRIQKLVR